jgi:hypothetical protein
MALLPSEFSANLAEGSTDAMVWQCSSQTTDEKGPVIKAPPSPDAGRRIET